jgi:Flp pilus assembly protein TadD
MQILGTTDTLAAKGDLDKALADYSEAIRLDPANATAYQRRGVVYQKKGNPTKAEEDFAQAKKLGYEAKPN